MQRDAYGVQKTLATGGTEMIEIVGGITIMVGWTGFVLWGLVEMAFAEARGNHQHSSPILCLIVGVALGAGMVTVFQTRVVPP
jgi:hypothetical protein